VDGGGGAQGLTQGRRQGKGAKGEGGRGHNSSGCGAVVLRASVDHLAGEACAVRDVSLVLGEVYVGFMCVEEEGGVGREGKAGCVSRGEGGGQEGQGG
jgi:hypothetical protein